MTEEGKPIGREIKLSEDLKVFLADIRVLNPALDFNPNETIMLTVILPGDHTVVTKGRSEINSDMYLATITENYATGKREIFPTTREEFTKRNYRVKVPAVILDQRWSAKSIDSFLQNKEEKVNAYELFKEIKEKFEFYIDFRGTENASSFASVYTVGTYFFPLFEYFPYLKLGGEKGSGKTKCGSVFAALCFNAQLSATETRASIYRRVQDTQGTMVIDEKENLAYKSEQTQDIFQILNSGYYREGKALLVDKDTMRPTRWSTYGPKVIIAIRTLEEVLNDRSFEVILLKTLDSEKKKTEVSLHNREWQPIRDKLYLCLFRYWPKVKDFIEKTVNEKDWEGRIWNLAKPILTLASFIDEFRPEKESSLKEKVTSFIEGQIKKKEERNRESVSSSAIEAVYNEILSLDNTTTLIPTTETEERTLILKNVAQRTAEIDGVKEGDLRGYSRTVQGVLKNLNLYQAIAREGHTGLTRFKVNLKDLIEIRRQLGLDEG